MPAKKQHSEDPSAITEFPKFFGLGYWRLGSSLDVGCWNFPRCTFFTLICKNLTFLNRVFILISC